MDLPQSTIQTIKMVYAQGHAQINAINAVALTLHEQKYGTTDLPIWDLSEFWAAANSLVRQIRRDIDAE